MKLLSMVKFVLNEQNNIMWDSFNRVVRYANFLNQTLTLGMFVPTDLEGNVLEEPVRDFDEYEVTERGNSEDAYYEDFFEYQQAKERVLFEGFLPKNSKMISKENDNELFFDIYFDENKINLYDGINHFVLETIEDLVKFNLTLSESAIKQIG